MEKLFVYGTLRDPAMQLRLVGRTLEGVSDSVRGFRRYQLPAYPVALPDKQHTLDGLVLTITAEELAVFDRYEGPTYRRIRVSLVSGGEAWLYQGDPAVYGPIVQQSAR